VLVRSSLLPVCALLSFLAGCGGPTSGGYAAVHFDPCQPLAVLPDADTTPEQRQAIADGIALWNAAASAQVSIAAAASGADLTSALPTLPLHYQRAAGAFHGLYDDRVAQVFINDDLSDHPRIVTIAHEVGHSFGLVHVSGGERPSVMNPDDVATLAGLWGRCAP
jgi:hypothetical protein